MKKKYILGLVILLAIGFASISTTFIFNGLIGIGVNENDFDIYFSEALLDDEDISADAISSDGKIINFVTKELINEEEQTILAYKVKNASTQYDAEVTVNFTFENNQDSNLNDFIEVSNSMSKEKINAGEEKQGFLTIKLKKAVIEKKQANIKCEIKTNAVDKTNKENIEGPSIQEETYSFYGFLKDENANKVENANLVIYSDEAHYTQTDERGYFYVNGLKEGSQEIYYLDGNLEDIKKLKKSQVKEKSISNVNITTSTRKIILSNQYIIDNFTIELDTERKYDLVLNPNGGNLDNTSKEIIQNRKYGELAIPKRDGYTFQGWYLEDQKIKPGLLVIPKISHTLVAKWSINSYEISFESMGGSTVSTILNVTYGETYGELPSTVQLGYTFQGWYTEPTGGTKIESSSKLEVSSNHTLYAHWTANQYTVSFDSNGGSAVNSTIKVIYDEMYGNLPTTSKTGYDFDGWYTSAYGGTKVENTSIVNIISNQILYAHWKASEYTVSFDSNGGSAVYSTIKVAYDGKYSPFGVPLPTTSKNGYTFQGWYTQVSGGTRVSENSIVISASNHTLYAHWTANQYTVSFDSNGGNAIYSTINVTYDGTYGTLPTPTRTGYTFQGWYNEYNIKVDNYTKVTITSNQKLHAQWTANHYIVSFNSNGGSYVFSTINVTYDGTYGMLPTTTKSGAIFQGWYTSAYGGTKVDTYTKVTTASNHTLYAQWR